MADLYLAVGQARKRIHHIAYTASVLLLAACGGGGGGGASAPTPEPTVAISSSIFAFDNQRVGTISPTQTVAISNSGTASLSISSITLAGTNAASFVISNGCGATLAVNSDCTVIVTFAPSTIGAMSASLALQTNAASNVSVALTGTGTASAASVNSNSVIFANQFVGTVSGPQIIGITNTGTATLDISGVSVGGPDATIFAQSNTCGSPIVPGATCSVSVTFAPTSVGSKSAALSIISDAPTNPSVSFNGTALLPPPPTASGGPITVNVLGVAPTLVGGSINATDPTGFALHYTMTSGATQGTATVNSSSGALTYQIPGYPSSPSVSTDAFSVSVSNGYTSTTVPVSVTLNSDPLLPNQWHIQNTGQNAFATTLPVAGNDMNVTGAWTSGYTGKGIKVGVVDTGMEATHEDLAANVDLSHSYNFVTGGNDPSPTTPGEDHGTQVAGIIGAVAFNGKGGRGVAYNVTLRGYNLLAAGSADTVANLANALGAAPVSADNDVFNASFGETGGQAVFDFLGPTIPTFDPAKGQINANTATLRNGLGAALVQAAGNDFRAWSNDRSATATACAYANQFGVSCGDPASDTRRASSYPIIVGALSASGKKASYSSSGSSVWIAAPGGEFGWDSNLTAGLTPFPDVAPFVVNPAIITTAHSGCAGYTILNVLDDQGSDPLATSCQYTAVMNGTSAATPNTVGAIALMLEANPNLTVRDIKYILAKTATQVDPTFAGVSTAGLLPSGTFQLEQGWVTNAAGYRFSNWYGFGGINAAAAVSMAKGYTTFLPASKQSTGTYAFTPATAVTIAAQSGSYIDFTVSESFNVVESALVYFNLASTPGMNCNQIELRSPSGTKSILMHGANGFGNLSVANARLESNAFYGESLNGTWRLTFWDLCVASGLQTVLPGGVPQTILFLGR